MVYIIVYNRIWFVLSYFLVIVENVEYIIMLLNMYIVSCIYCEYMTDRAKPS